MTLRSGRPDRLDRGASNQNDLAPASNARRARLARRPVVEGLEGRQLLSGFYTGLSATRPVQTAGGVYNVSVSGPGLVRVQRLGKGAVGVTLLGSTDATTLNVSQSYQKLHKPTVPLQIGSIKVVSGVIGGINAPTADLVGAVSPLNGVQSISFGRLAQNARLDVAGSLASLSVGGVNLGPNGRVRIAGSLGQSLNVAGGVVLDGGQFLIGSDVSGALNLGALNVQRGGQFVVGHSVTAASSGGGTVRVADNGLVMVGQDLNGLAVAGNLGLDTGGRLIVGNDLLGPLTTGENLAIGKNARLSVGRDVSNSTGTGGISVGGNLALTGGGLLTVGRDLGTGSSAGGTTASPALAVSGNLTVDPTGGEIIVGGNLNTLQVGGVFHGKGTADADLKVGLDLRNTTIIGSTPNDGGLQFANIDVTKNIIGLNVLHGIFHSLVTAGVLIDGVNVGPDGADAVLNSNIRAGVKIDNTVLNGDVRSTFATDPNAVGYATRIVAGQDRAGMFTNGGSIDHFQILGAMYDSVVAASVAPNGGNGTLPVSAYGAPAPECSDTPGDGGSNTYDAPFGTITVGADVYDNYTQLSYKDGKLVGVSYNTALDPTIDDCILFGSINASYAGAGLPTESTVLGGVISSNHSDDSDFAGLFAADTKGVFIGRLPDSNT
ncbi:MAG: hypothetical protein U0835_19410 [Isosphaeraceae bacterium]